jgi:hypothetical protein
MRSMVPRMRTVSCADAGKMMQIKAKLAANMRCIVPDIAIPWVRQRVERRYLQHQQYPDIPDQKTAANLKSLTHRNRRAPIRS